MLRLDGAQGEGGGQVLRTALALSLVTGTPFRIERIRAGRQKPGLRRQHLTSVRAAAAVGHARVEGAELGSPELVFRPGPVEGGDYSFAVGTAGSACLVVQTILPPLLTASGPSTVVIEGGTHNPFAPPFDFLARVFLPQLARMGARVQAQLDRPGFYPAGGGRIRIHVEPASALEPLTLLERAPIDRRRAVAMVSRLPRHIAQRELAVVQEKLGWSAHELEMVEVTDSVGPGNVLMLEVSDGAVTEIVTAFGKPGLRAEVVAERAVREMRQYLESGVPVGAHLADQLLLPLALAGGGTFRTAPLSAHSTTNIGVIREFLPVPIAVDEDANGRACVRVG